MSEFAAPINGPPLQAALPGWARPADAWIDARKFLAIAAQLAILLVFIRQFEVEPGSGIQRILILLFAGFVAHAVLPLRYRLPFFLLLSLVAIGLVIGVVPAVAVIVTGLTLIGIAHLPLTFSLRVALILVVAAFLIAVR